MSRVVWKCADCEFVTFYGSEAGDHERENNGGSLWESAPRATRSHSMWHYDEDSLVSIVRSRSDEYVRAQIAKRREQRR